MCTASSMKGRKSGFSGDKHSAVISEISRGRSECLLTILQVAAAWEQQCGVTISLRLAVWPAVVVYAIEIYTSAKIVVTSTSTAPLGIALLVSAAVQTILMLTASILELFK